MVLVKRIKTYFCKYEEFGIVEKGLGHFFITTSSFFFNKNRFQTVSLDNSEEHLHQNQLSSVYVHSVH